MARRLSREGIILLVLAGLLLVAVGIGLVRHLARGQVKLEALSEAALKVKLNEAGIEELSRLPGIGPGLASRIVSYRDTHGSFFRAESLLAVPGIGQKKLDEIKPYLEVP